VNTLRSVAVALAATLLAVALAATLLAATPSPISQSGLLLQSSANPRIALRIAGGFVPLRPLTLSLESTDVDRRMFVDADEAHTVRRLIVVQFEHVRPGASFKFVYPPKPPFAFGGETYRLGTYVYDDAKDSAAAPNRESGVTRAALLKQGYVLPRLFRTARLARVADPDGTSEIIIFYNENADAQYPAGPLAGADEDGDLGLKGAEADALLKRMTSTLSVVPASASPPPSPS
jgi:hypothetical protein